MQPMERRWKKIHVETRQIWKQFPSETDRRWKKIGNATDGQEMEEDTKCNRWRELDGRR